MNEAYLSQPTISKTQIAFISDDDLWTVGHEGGTARRLTANRGIISSPCFSPDGQSIAFISTDTSAEGDIYLIAADGGEAHRLTWLGVPKIVGWKDNNILYFLNGMDGYPRREAHVYELDIRSQDFKKINLGPASYYHNGRGFQVLARNSGDSARWKRYQGGTAGVIWSQQGREPFKRILKNIKTNIARPEVIEKTIYFISDHEGVANVYSCDLDGRKIKRLTNHIEYYCRNLRSNGELLVYQLGAQIVTLNLKTGAEKILDILTPTTAMQAVVRYESWNQYFQGADLNPQADKLAVISRGHLFQMAPFDGPVRELDQSKNIRYSYPNYNFDGSKLLVAGVHGQSEENLYSFDLKSGEKTHLFPKIKWGKIWGINCSPKSDLAAVITNKKEVYILDLKKNKFKIIETNKFNRPVELEWSPDGRYLAYTAQYCQRRTAIRIYDTKTEELRFLMRPISQDFSPSFDPEGKYLYFLSVRDFAPNYNETHFDLGFPFAIKPYVVSLKAETPNPFDTPFESPKKPKDEKKKDTKKDLVVEIEFDGIENRVLGFKLELGGYSRLVGIRGGIMYWRKPVQPVENHDRYFEFDAPSVYVYKFEDASNEIYYKNVRYFYLNANRDYVLTYGDSKLRLNETKAKPTAEAKIGKKDGYVDGSRIKLKIDPRLEWVQMYNEAWILQKEHFWREDMSKIEWELVYKRYLKLLPKIRTRLEFSDLMWEMQGELGTSHCYEMLGDYDRHGAGISLGRLGAYFEYVESSKSFLIKRILKGDSWLLSADSPLTAMGVCLKEGDRLLGLDGVRFSKAADLYHALECKGGTKVELEVQRSGSKKSETLVVKTNRANGGAWYRDWVEKNKAYVHKISKGKLGYVHVPDMGTFGYAEFYRNFVNESQNDGLVVDVRFNGGGHVSQHLLKVLAQKAIGFDETRYQGFERYPFYSPGVLVALANEYSGSDGDIFPHSFKLMKLGKVIGKRTWGGVIGINGQYSLRDGTWVTQPEYSFWFQDNEWYVENHGVDPDIEVEMTPEAHRDGLDPQLDRAIQEALKEIGKNPPLKFNPSYYPDLRIPKKLEKLTR